MKHYSRVDQAMARRFEAADANHNAGYAIARQEIHPDVNAETLNIGDGTAIFAGPDLPMNRVVGLGTAEAVTAAVLDQVEAFYHAHEAVPMVDLCPLADPSLVALLRERGYVPARFFNIFYRWLPADDYVPEFLGHLIETAFDLTTWQRVITDGFGETDTTKEADPNLLFAELAFRKPDVTAFTVRVQDELAGGGAVCIHENVALLFSASSRVGFRRRGVHSALLKARLDYAAQSGCDVAMVATVPGAPSEKNIHRVGFRLAYTKVVLQLPQDR